MGDVDHRADRAHGVWAIGGVAIDPPSVDGYPAHRPVGPLHPVHAVPFAAVGRPGSGLEAALHGTSVAFIEQAGGLRNAHLRSRRQTKDGAQLRREPGQAALEVGLVNADAPHRHCKMQKLFVQQLFVLIYRVGLTGRRASGRCKRR